MDRRGTHNRDGGFTLIELMVVVLIIAILLGIAIPTFLGTRDRARDRATQSDLRNALTAAKTIAADNDGQFSLVDATTMADTEGSLSYEPVGASATGVGRIGLPVRSATELILNVRSASGEAFCIRALRDGAVTYGKAAKGSAMADVDDAADCGAATF